MLLIDIINSLNFPGSDFESVLIAAFERRRFLNPILRRIVDYASQQPGAFQCRFSDGLLLSSAYLLARSNDCGFLELVAPLIDVGIRPSLLGHYPEDSARLLAEVIPSQLDRLLELITRKDVPVHFRSDGFEACVLAILWDEENRQRVISKLLSILRGPRLGLIPLDARSSLVAACCRIDPSEFIIDLQFAMDRGDISEEETNGLIAEASRRSTNSVWLQDWMFTSPLGPKDAYLAQHGLTFSAEELRQSADEAFPDPDALAVYNSISVPKRGYVEKVLEIQVTPKIVDVCRRVMRLVANAPDEYRPAHHPVAVSAAICLAAPTGDPDFALYLAKFLRGPQEFLDCILWDDQVDLCDSALALSARSHPEYICEVIEDSDASWVSRSVALEALFRQIELGFRPAGEVAEYCRDLVRKRQGLRDDPLFWTSVVKISARLQLIDLRPALLQMVGEGFFRDESATIYMEAEEIVSEFDEPYVDPNAPTLKTTEELLRKSYDFPNRRVKEFLGCLEPPDLKKLRKEIEEADLETES